MTQKNPTVKLRSISIQNYKGIGTLKLEFPVPMMSDDPDIVVMGSENGLGKTSIMECCALLMMSLSIRESSFRLRGGYFSFNVPDLLITAGADTAKIAGKIDVGRSSVRAEMMINRDGKIELKKEGRYPIRNRDVFAISDNMHEQIIKEILGLSPNPVINNSFLLFHSYRKVQEGNLDIRSLVRDPEINRPPSILRRYDTTDSKLKAKILSSLMSEAGLFDLDEEKDPEGIINKLNEMMRLYADGSIGKLRPTTANTFDFRVKLDRGNDSISLDGLSSGQKEIISTLFLIWSHTRDIHVPVFIDEPEMHLNAEWHRSFVNYLFKLAPQNQYIIATHSPYIMDSVDKSQRVMFTKQGKSNE